MVIGHHQHQSSEHNYGHSSDAHDVELVQTIGPETHGRFRDPEVQHMHIKANPQSEPHAIMPRPRLHADHPHSTDYPNNDNPAIHPRPDEASEEHSRGQSSNNTDDSTKVKKITVTTIGPFPKQKQFVCNRFVKSYSRFLDEIRERLGCDQSIRCLKSPGGTRVRSLENLRGNNTTYTALCPNDMVRQALGPLSHLPPPPLRPVRRLRHEWIPRSNIYNYVPSRVFDQTNYRCRCIQREEYVEIPGGKRTRISTIFLPDGIHRIPYLRNLYGPENITHYYIVYLNGDFHRRPHRILIDRKIESTNRPFELLLKYAEEKCVTKETRPCVVRKLYDLNTGRPITDINEIEDGMTLVACPNFERLILGSYGRVDRPMNCGKPPSSKKKAFLSKTPTPPEGKQRPWGPSNDSSPRHVELDLRGQPPSQRRQMNPLAPLPPISKRPPRSEPTPHTTRPYEPLQGPKRTTRSRSVPRPLLESRNQNAWMMTQSTTSIPKDIEKQSTRTPRSKTPTGSFSIVNGTKKEPTPRTRSRTPVGSQSKNRSRGNSLPRSSAEPEKAKLKQSRLIKQKDSKPDNDFKAQKPQTASDGAQEIPDTTETVTDLPVEKREPEQIEEEELESPPARQPSEEEIPRRPFRRRATSPSDDRYEDLSEEKTDERKDDEEAKRNAAATTVQAGYRGYQTRKNLAEQRNAHDESPAKPVVQEQETEKEEQELEEDLQEEPLEEIEDSVPKEDEQPVKDEKPDDKQDEAAIKIQASYRGYKTRKEIKSRKDEETGHNAEPVEDEIEKTAEKVEDKVESAGPSAEESAATTIQAGYRGYRTRKYLKTQADEVHDAKYKDESTEDEVEETAEMEDEDKESSGPSAEDKAATTIQAGYRGYKTRKDLKTQADEDAKHKDEPIEDEVEETAEMEDEDKESSGPSAEDKAATTIQAGYRGYKTRKDLKRQADEEKEHKDEPKDDPVEETADKEEDKESSGPSAEDKAATTIQAGYRGYKTRKNLKRQVHEDEKNEKEAATKIQARYRGYKTRKDLTAAQEKEKNENERKEKAATAIQAGYRGYKTRKSRKSKEEKDEKDEPKAEEPPQEEKQPEEEVKSEDDEEKKRVEAATKIQAGYRGYQTRQQLKDNKTAKEDKPQEEPKPDEEAKEPQQDENKDNEEQRKAEAATKIQAGYRGYQTRLQLKNQQNPPQEPTSEESAKANGVDNEAPEAPPPPADDEKPKDSEKANGVDGDGGAEVSQGSAA